MSDSFDEASVVQLGSRRNNPGETYGVVGNVCIPHRWWRQYEADVGPEEADKALQGLEDALNQG